MELNGTHEDKSKIGLVLQETVGASAKILQLMPRALVEIRLINTITEVSGVEQALKKFFKHAVYPEIKIRLTKSAFRGTIKTIVELEEQAAFECDKRSHIKVGWVNCYV